MLSKRSTPSIDLHSSFNLSGVQKKFYQRHHAQHTHQAMMASISRKVCVLYSTFEDGKLLYA
jgi:hypothetical protein